ncbi:hypothetical protein TWF694_005909 [Orbilia ellipsospora]|uniref:Uncharacterized protein n=1 Tax=Orbilia ellipsospora TaxID=2528407 RepID=A0AAV9WYD0_9PEZI
MPGEPHTHRIRFLGCGHERDSYVFIQDPTNVFRCVCDSTGLYQIMLDPRTNTATYVQKWETVPVKCPICARPKQRMTFEEYKEYVESDGEAVEYPDPKRRKIG